MILTDQHTRPDRLINTGTGTVSSAALIKQGDIQRMASLGLYRHESIGSGPYGDWELSSDAEGSLYTRQTRDLTPEEIELRREQLQDQRSLRRAEVQASGFMHDGHIYRSDQNSRMDLTAATLQAQMATDVAAFEQTLGEGWRDAIGTPRITTRDGFLALHAALATWLLTVDAASQVLKKRIAGADLAEFDELEAALSGKAGWPRHPVEWDAETTYASGDQIRHANRYWYALPDVAAGYPPDDVYDLANQTGGWAPL
jgi:hypothetical protein